MVYTDLLTPEGMRAIPGAAIHVQTIEEFDYMCSQPGALAGYFDSTPPGSNRPPHGWVVFPVEEKRREAEFLLKELRS